VLAGGGSCSISVASKENLMSNNKNLGEAIKRFGYAKKKKIKLYRKELDLVSDPVSRQGDNVFVDAREEGKNDVRQVQVPRNIVEMAKGSLRRGTK
jgi:hypothetical protein